MLVGACKFSNKCRKSWAYSNSVFFSVRSLLNPPPWLFFHLELDLWILFPKSHKVAVNLSTRNLDTSNKKVNQIQKSLGLGPTSMTQSANASVTNDITFLIGASKKPRALCFQLVPWPLFVAPESWVHSPKKGVASYWTILDIPISSLLWRTQK